MSSPNNGAADEVLKIYRATKTSLKEHQDAFDGAVGVYRETAVPSRAFGRGSGGARRLKRCFASTRRE